ncbi:MAG TPA: hypothetical protein VMU32_05460 [Solirubrobacteraceae bacterium]|nr:hypothetical protein [Solirubrobacteraceae bacterium]
MATVGDSTRTPGSVLASQRMDAAIEDVIAERPARYPNGAAFVGADMPGLGKILARRAREGRAVVLVYPDGEERIIESHKPLDVPKAA